jgi:hypothetical protein
MKVNAQMEPAPITSGTMPTLEIGISDDPEDQLMILNVLSNTLYTDKVAAVLREYGCNAADANVEAGKASQPIHVRLPNRLDPTVAIRDFGLGMTAQEVEKTFCKLGRSTKRGSNDFTGMLGIGSKAGFAYGDSFTVTCFINGTKHIYNCYRDQGKPRMALMGASPTDEQDGVEVKVPVKQADIHEFEITAARVFRYFSVPPVITGVKVQLNRPTPEFSGKGWRYTGDGTSVAIMGNVGYDLNVASMGLPYDSKTGSLITAGIELEFPIGALEIAANREGIQYKDLTKKAIMARCQQVTQEIAADFTKRVSAAKSEWEARALYQDYKSTGYNRHHLNRLLSGAVVWNGKPVTSASIELWDDKDKVLHRPTISIYHTGNGYRRSKMRRGTVNPTEIYASEKTTLCINDLPKISPQRVAGFFHNNPTKENLVIFTFSNIGATTTYWKKYLDNAPSIKLSTLPKWVDPNKVATTSSGVPSVHRAKHSRHAFTLNRKAPDSRYDPRSSWFTPVSVDYKDGQGIYVLLQSFWVKHPNISTPAPGMVMHPINPSKLFDTVEMIRAAGLLKPTEAVYGIKISEGETPKLGDGWKPLNVALAERVDAWGAKDKNLQALRDYQAWCAHEKWLEINLLPMVPVGSAAHDLLTAYVEMSAPVDMKLVKLLVGGSGHPWLSAPDKLPHPSKSLDGLCANMVRTYPMIKQLGRHGAVSANLTTLSDYIKLVESK